MKDDDREVGAWWLEPIVPAWEDYDAMALHGERVFQLDAYRATLGIPSIFG